MAEIKKVKNIVIGSGPAGRLASFELGKLGEETVVIEKKHIAGTCLNEGCMVVCALTDISRFIRNFKRFSEIGFINGEINLDYKKACENVKNTQKFLRKLNQEENESVNNEVIYGEASVSVEDDKIFIKVDLDKENELQRENIRKSDEETLTFEAENLLVATGARPFIPDIKGKEHVLVSSDILDIEELPKQLNIVGGGIIATELSNIFSSFGVDVKIIARSKILKELDVEIKDYVVKKLIEEVEILEDTDVIEIKENSIVTDKGEFEGKTLIATGRIPNSEILDGIVELNEDGSVKVNEFFQSSNPHIYAAGDLTGGVCLTPVARKEGISAARNMAGYLNKVEDVVIPQSLTLDLDVSFTKRPDNDIDTENIEDVIIPGLGGPHAFWRILNGGTGITKVSLNAETEKVEKVSSISPSSVDDTAYLAFLMNMGIDKEAFDDFLEVHPSTDAYYKILKIM
ncbi:MAG: NAD(P)/FAD-dependent oxidoreductase [Methanobrevibacter sp.]|nr:NAD(P)/FAD-dependent oxidoreductase [Methanobrevibacter sp.]